jgi:acetyltransferase-like isoleucine patch superfamily enzyme
MTSKFDLTLFGFSATTYPVLTELAAVTWGIPISELRVQVIHNLAIPSFTLPPQWPCPQHVNLSEWKPDREIDGVMMPGVMHEPAVSAVYHDVIRATGIADHAFGSIAHPSATIAPSAALGPGTWIHARANVATLARVGLWCHLNIGTSIGHHSVLDDFSRLNPGAITSGQCTIGKSVTIGAGAVCRDRITIGDGAFIGAGAVVVKAVSTGQVVVGNPAKPLRNAAQSV